MTQHITALRKRRRKSQLSQLTQINACVEEKVMKFVKRCGGKPITEEKERQNSEIEQVLRDEMNPEGEEKKKGHHL